MSKEKTNDENPFTIFGLRPKYFLDQKALDKSYFKLQFDNHPDKENGNTAFSARLNFAYQILKNPVKRAAALLEVLKLPVPGSDTSPFEGSSILLEILEFQEAISLCKSEEDLMRIKHSLIELYYEEQKAFAKYFDKKNYEEMTECYVKLAYTENLCRQIREAEERFFQKSFSIH
jgi:molecular chaperone HscB